MGVTHHPPSLHLHPTWQSAASGPQYLEPPMNSYHGRLSPQSPTCYQPKKWNEPEQNQIPSACPLPTGEPPLSLIQFYSILTLLSLIKPNFQFPMTLNLIMIKMGKQLRFEQLVLFLYYCIITLNWHLNYITASREQNYSSSCCIWGKEKNKYIYIVCLCVYICYTYNKHLNPPHW